MIVVVGRRRKVATTAPADSPVWGCVGAAVYAVVGRVLRLRHEGGAG